MDSCRDDRQVEVVKHDVDVLVDASVEAKVQTQRSTADALERTWVLGPEHRQKQTLLYVKQLCKVIVFTCSNP